MEKMLEMLFTFFIIVLMFILFYTHSQYKKLEGHLFTARYSFFKAVNGSISFSASLSFYFADRAAGYLFMPLGITLLYQGLGRMRLGENGVYMEGIFLLWDEIECFYWDLEKQQDLILRTKSKRTFILWSRKIKYTVHQNDKAQIHRILSNYLIESITA